MTTPPDAHLSNEYFLVTLYTVWQIFVLPPILEEVNFCNKLDGIPPELAHLI